MNETGERVNMGGKVLDKHYDKGMNAEKAERRRDYAGSSSTVEGCPTIPGQFYGAFPC